MGVRLSNGRSHHLRRFQNLNGERNEVLKGDLRLTDSHLTNGVVGVKCVLPFQEWPEAVNDFFCEAVKRIGLESLGIVLRASLPNAIPQVRACIDFEGDGEDPL